MSRPSFAHEDLVTYLRRAWRGEVTIVCASARAARSLRNALYHVQRNHVAKVRIELNHKLLTLRPPANASNITTIHARETSP